MTTKALSINVAKANPAAAYLASLRSDVSKRGMRSRLNAVARVMKLDHFRDINWNTMNAANVQALLNGIEGAPATVNTTLAALRGVARAAYRLGIIDREAYDQIKDLKPVRGSRLLAGRDVADDEAKALLAACKKSDRYADKRDAAMLAIAMQTGMRREEIVKLSTKDVTPTEKGYALLVRGKGDKQRKAFVSKGAARVLRHWLDARGADAGSIFCYITKGNNIRPMHGLSTTAASHIMTKRRELAGVEKMGWHDLRRTTTGKLLDAGVDVVTVAGIMGHADPKTTARYDRRPLARREAAADLIEIPE